VALFRTVVRRNRKGRPGHETSPMMSEAAQGNGITEHPDAAYAEKGVP